VDDRKHTGNTSATVLLILLLVLGLVLAWNSYSFSRSETVSPEMAEASLKASIYLVALAVDAEFQETGVYPRDLESIEVEEEEVTYTPTSNGYTLVAVDEERSFEYRSGEDLDPYRSAFEYLLPGSRAR
jgi:hypothetical protein